MIKPVIRLLGGYKIDYLKRVTYFLNKTADQYSIYLFDLGVEYLEKYYPNKTYYSETTLYWEYLEAVINVLLIDAMEDLEGGYLIDENEINVTFKNDIFKTMLLTTDLVRCLENEYLKLKNQTTQPRTSKNKNNQLETNLNTI
ncbi:hypothetical protein [Flavobacterium branchiophilum]|uniref:Uncharacterized protein n=1 Tax=Flavobacterium branchiophilum TaxID=55197 RepID=A0A2H3KLC9_9FLAO|nr:hypothetical protein [Flavobacterium branchiophilum]PDS23803.1 hypothetical protein B0A77_09885 [Flavobacterium branchiophilum]